MRRFTVDISEDAFGLLSEVANRERRALREQAAVVLEQALAIEFDSPDPRSSGHETMRYMQPADPAVTELTR